MPERHESSSTTARRRMSLVLPWVLPVLFIASVLAFAVRGGDEQDRALEPAPSNVMGHIHGLGVDAEEQTLYIGAHFGFFRASAGEAPERVGRTRHDTMAFLRVGAGDFLASGHPDLRSDLPVHLGLVGSTDEGQTWQSLSLGGEADFHALDVAGRWVVGYDSHRQRILASNDRKTWTTIDERPMLDPRLSASGDQELDEVGVERLEGTGAAVDDDRGTAGTRRDMGELEGDEATTDEQDPRREHLQIQEVGAVDQVLVTAFGGNDGKTLVGDLPVRAVVEVQQGDVHVELPSAATEPNIRLRSEP